jgi:hypothetical protein
MHLGIAVTPGQRDVQLILFGPPSRHTRPAKQGSIIARVRHIFVILILIELAGAVLSFIPLVP